jgi:coenzyme PQQ synthesis protein D (PqqD)
MSDATRPEMMSGKARVPKHVVYRAFAHETVMLNLNTGKYHGLNPTAGRMLEALESAETVGAAAARLADEYGRPAGEIEADLFEFCLDLRARGLLEVVGDSDVS